MAMFKGIKSAIVAPLLVLAGCTTNGSGGSTEQVFGMASCHPEDMTYCNGLAGHTHRSWGPEQIEYIAPDGQLSLWIGNRIVKGKWRIAHGLIGSSMCYGYEPRISNLRCEKLSSELRMKDDTRPGDPFGLANRVSPPFPLKAMDRREFDQLLAEVAAQ